MDFDDIFDIEDDEQFRIALEKHNNDVYGNDQEILVRTKGIQVIANHLNDDQAESCYRHAIFLIKDNAYGGNVIDIIKSIAIKNGGEINIWQAIEIYRYLSDPDNYIIYDVSQVPDYISTSEQVGLLVTNPVMVPGIKFSYIFLNSIQTATGEQITYQRIKSISSPHHGKPIDMYEIKTVDGKKLNDIFIFPYSKYLLPIPPAGYNWISYSSTTFDM